MCRVTPLQVQEVLCRPGHVERYFPSSPSAAASVRATFAHIVSLEHVSQDFRASVVADPDVWVLKPQREGGASNLFGSEIARAFETWDDAALMQYASHPLRVLLLPAVYFCNMLRRYILMERLCPPSFPAEMLRNGKEERVQVLLLLLLLLLLLTPDPGRMRNRHVRPPAPSFSIIL